MTAIKAEPSKEALLALADEIENSDGLIRILKTAGTIQLGIKKTAQIVAALRAPAGNDGAVREARERRLSVAAALARRLCQLFDSGGESQRSVRARHASAIFQILNRDKPEYLAEQRWCDASPISYLERGENLALEPQNGGEKEQ